MSWEQIPIVDFCHGRQDQSSPEFDTVVREITNAFENVGFVYLRNHGIPLEKVDRIFKLNEQFFDLPAEQKLSYQRGEGLDHHGYCPIASERTNTARPGDFKECYDVDIFNENEKRWPSDEEFPGFKSFVTDFYRECEQLWLALLRVMGHGLNLKDVNYLADRHDPTKPTTTILRMIKYPAVTSHDLEADQMRCGEHSDYGSLTLLFQDNAGGLQVWNKHLDKYIDAVPVDDTVLVNLGDLMQRWTADRLISTKHRVVNPDFSDKTMTSKHRRSTIVFVFPNNGCSVECVDGSAKYPPIIADDYLEYMYAKTF